jgi:hypothetical protein
VGAAFGPLGMPVHFSPSDHEGALGYADAFGGGLGQRRGITPQATPVGRRPGDPLGRGL